MAWAEGVKLAGKVESELVVKAMEKRFLMPRKSVTAKRVMDFLSVFPFCISSS
jgi:hypothetical protein